MYVFDFFKKLFMKKNNLPIVIYLVINTLMMSVGIAFLLNIWLVFHAELEGATIYDTPTISIIGLYGLALLLGVVVYVICLAIALSPLGECIIRWQNGCKKIKYKTHLDVIEPAFNEVYEAAKQHDPSIPDDVKIYMCDDEVPNAFAVGRKTICVSEGLLRMPEIQIKAVLGHEIGHLAQKDTDIILVVAIGNIMINIVVWLVQVAIILMGYATKALTTVFRVVFSFIPVVGWIADILGRIYGYCITLMCSIISFIVIGLFFKGWTMLGFWLVRKSSRDNEYGADEFSFNLGYGNALCCFLDYVAEDEIKEGLFAILSKSHPDKNLRIAKLQELGATYKSQRNVE